MLQYWKSMGLGQLNLSFNTPSIYVPGNYIGRPESNVQMFGFPKQIASRKWGTQSGTVIPVMDQVISTYGLPPELMSVKMQTEATRTAQIAVEHPDQFFGRRNAIAIPITTGNSFEVDNKGSRALLNVSVTTNWGFNRDGRHGLIEGMPQSLRASLETITSPGMSHEELFGIAQRLDVIPDFNPQTQQQQ